MITKMDLLNSINSHIRKNQRLLEELKEGIERGKSRLFIHELTRVNKNLKKMEKELERLIRIVESY